MSEKVDGLSMDITAAEQDKLRAVFPQCFVEGKLDERKLMELLGTFDTIDENDREKYEFRWKGKQEALQLAGKRSAGTLRPCPEESVDWDTTRNLYIEGDNLEVLKLLQTSYYRKVKMIYIDPPYNTGNDFVYADDFADPLARYREVTQQTTKSNPESMGRFHTNWLNMMLPRLRLAANLLQDDGVIFISIDDGEQANMRKLCDEVFGEENFVANIMWQKRYSPSNDHKTICPMHDFIMVYQKSSAWQRNLMPRSEENNKQYRYEDERGKFRASDYTCNKTTAERPNLNYPIINPKTGEEVWPSPNAAWRYTKERHEENLQNGLVFWGKDGNARVPAYKRYLDELPNGGGIVPVSWWPHELAGHNDEAAKEVGELIGGRVFSTPKPIKLITKLLQLATNPSEGDIILDFFSGSGATAHAVMQLNAEDSGKRRFILVQLPEVCDEKSEAYKAGYKNICEIGKERIRRAGAKIAVERSEINRELKDALKANQLTIHADFVPAEGSDQQKQITEQWITATSFDSGFRIFKLDSSNLKQWDNSPVSGENAVAEFEQRLLGMLEILKPDRSDVDVVYEVMLKLGQDLCEPIVTIDLPGERQVYGVGADVKFIVCLALNITVEDAAIMAEYAPGRIVFADQCFTSSEAKSNVKLTLRDKGITIKVL